MALSFKFQDFQSFLCSRHFITTGRHRVFQICLGNPRSACVRCANIQRLVTYHEVGGQAKLYTWNLFSMYFQWFSLIFDDFWWFSMIFDGFQWFTTLSEISESSHVYSFTAAYPTMRRQPIYVGFGILRSTTQVFQGYLGHRHRSTGHGIRKY